MSKKIEKLFKSYRDQLLHLAKLYGVVEIKSYARSAKRLTISQLELLLIKNRIKLPINRSSDKAIAKQELKENSIRNIYLSIGFIIFMVVGVIFAGFATPSESAASGALGTFLLAVVQRRMSWSVFKKAIVGSLEISVMILLIISGALAFTQMLAFTGATSGLISMVLSFNVSPIALISLMLVTVIVLGMLMSPVPIMLVTLPVFIPVVEELGFSAIWFAVLYLIAIETGSTSPPFGAGLFVMKGVAPKGTTMNEIYRAAVPFLICDLIAILLVLAFPAIVSWPLAKMF